jgi:hypothetical protein
MTLGQYIDNINNRYRLGNSTEHTFRGDLQHLNSKNISIQRKHFQGNKAPLRKDDGEQNEI